MKTPDELVSELIDALAASSKVDPEIPETYIRHIIDSFPDSDPAIVSEFPYLKEEMLRTQSCLFAMTGIIDSLVEFMEQKKEEDND